MAHLRVYYYSTIQIEKINSTSKELSITFAFSGEATVHYYDNNDIKVAKLNSRFPGDTILLTKK